jgi:hypothetical protein
MGKGFIQKRHQPLIPTPSGKKITKKKINQDKKIPNCAILRKLKRNS